MSKQVGEPLLKVRHLKQYFNEGQNNEVRAIDDISFDIYPGETFGLVGESGSGKTTTGRAIIRLYNPTDGQIIFEGNDIAQLKSRHDMLDFRKDIQMIFQDPYASLNPRMKVEDIIAEGLTIHNLVKSKSDLKTKVGELLSKVGLNPNHGSRYPHEFSGGQRQRIGIARALAVNPKMIVADEPISALDVSIQAQVVNLLQELQDEFDLTFLFIAHDLSMVKYISDRIGVMYHGKLVEMGAADEIYFHGLHPYTKSLLSAIPLPDPIYERNRKRITYDHAEFSGDEMMTEIAPGHYVYCRPDEVDGYKKEYQQRLG
ncbi:ABC transporter ATP-binding protein [Aerococcus kribbianus]|uniref:ATP-binding cassette domain-containing protein n=1 Tax=Aerococcus kribbianus TaxID=2999064 RepID=A0A9X3FLZ9_9LACT|nr:MULTISPECIES: ATP-binding cassette domain-containing protein [unclassified Aerococcus]MCZ0716955.1 ATP-binding cassette domain-containing protein [Aerococcus sp. YH-aer221]MCZ0725243.1 ATP-binding cassette domain-containing protein [Aerococcus sp. YH-aer222]